MISIIIPTMWKAPHMFKMLPTLNDHPLVGEIIFIDNDKEKADKEFLGKLNKLVYLPQEQNIFVNPAWNLGVKHSKYDRLCIINDDCLANIRFLESIYTKLTPETGLFGFSSDSYSELAAESSQFSIETFDTMLLQDLGTDVWFNKINPLEFRDFSGMPHPAYGSFMFMHKESYYEIPEFKIFYGDLFLYLMNLKNKKQNYTIENGLICTVMSSSVGTNGFGFIETPPILEDKEAFVPTLQQYGLYNLDLAGLDN